MDVITKKKKSFEYLVEVFAPIRRQIESVLFLFHI